MKAADLPMAWARCLAIWCVTVLSVALAAGCALAGQGYTPRPCGFDLNFNGTIGEPADCHVCDGVTTDVDGNGVADVLKYVDCQSGSDTGGAGSAANPYKTIQKAMSVLSTPAASQIQAVCFKGTCSETVTPTQSGAAGVYTRLRSGSEAADFNYPRYPLILSGWDADNNGAYPPYDAANTAVLDGNLVVNLGLAIANANNRSNLELAHFSVRDYGLACPGSDAGVMKMAAGGAGNVDRISIHDLSLAEINSRCVNSSSLIAFNFFIGSAVLTYAAIENVDVQNYGSYFARGIGTTSGSPDAGPWRVKNVSLRARPADNDSVAGIKLWNYVTGVEVLDSVFDANLGGWTCTSCPSNSFAIDAAQCSRNWTIRNNSFYNWAQALNVQPDAGPSFCQSRSVDGIVFDRNTVRITTNPWQFGHFGIQIGSGPTLTTTVGNVSITNNMITSSAGYSGCIWSSPGNNQGPNPGAVNIVGNVCFGSITQWYAISIGDITGGTKTYPQQNYVVKDNIVAGLNSGNVNVWTGYAPANLALDGNVYSSVGNFVWNKGAATNFATWKTNSQEGAASKTCSPTFVNAGLGDFHLASNDACAKDAGVSVASVTTIDLDGETRPYGVAWDSGADEYAPAGGLPAPPTLIEVVPLSQ